MSIMRGLDSNGDFLFGKGQNDYVSGKTAVGQDIQTRIKSFLGDCFFATGDGIDWFSYIGAKNPIGLNLAISATILNTANVTGILQLYVNLTSGRVLQVSYKVQTIYGEANNAFQYDLNGLV